LEESYIDDVLRMADINHALGDNQWAAAVKFCDEALAERPRWSEVRAARDRAASYLETGGQPPPSRSLAVFWGALVTYKTKKAPRDIVPRKSFLDVPDDALLQVLLCMSYPRCAVLSATNK